VFTARYALSPYIKHIRFVFKGLTIVPAAGEAGFIPDALLIYKSSARTCDYHVEMNGDSFIKWLRERLILNLPPRSVIVLGNAPYHSVQNCPATTSNSTKKGMPVWLSDRNMPFSPNMFKAELFEICVPLAHTGSHGRKIFCHYITVCTPRFTASLPGRKCFII
jgi:hypothetical protein